MQMKEKISSSARTWLSLTSHTFDTSSNRNREPLLSYLVHSGHKKKPHACKRRPCSSCFFCVHATHKYGGNCAVAKSLDKVWACFCSADKSRRLPLTESSPKLTCEEGNTANLIHRRPASNTHLGLGPGGCACCVPTLLQHISRWYVWLKEGRWMSKI